MTNAGKHLTLREVISSFQSGNYDSGSNSGETLFFEGDVLYSYGYHFPLLVRKGNKFLRNIDSYSQTTAKHQSYAYGGWMIDFSYKQFKQIGIEKAEHFEELEILDTAGDDLLFKFRDNFYLSGKTLESKGGRDYFLVELLKDKLEDYVGELTVGDAKDSMCPEEVKQAVVEERQVYRSGEWFFVKNKHRELGMLTVDDMLKVKDGNVSLVKNASLESSNHTVGQQVDFRNAERTLGKLFAKGQVKHVGKKNIVLKLDDWYEVYKNTIVKSF